MGIRDLKVVPACLCLGAIFLIVFGIIGLAVSLISLDQGRYALKLNWRTQKIAEEVVTEPGMYNVGFGNMLLEYPSIYQNMHFTGEAGTGNCNKEDPGPDCEQNVYRRPVLARSKDGLEMSIAVSFQWKLEPQALRPLYSILGHDLYRDEFIRFARASVVESCSMFTADKFFSNRTQITADMLDKLRIFFRKPEKNMELVITGLQLGDVDLPDAFDEEIRNTQEQIQDIEVAKAEREERKIALEREIMVAEQAVLEITERARGTADQIIQENNATVDQLLNTQKRQAESNALILKIFQNDTDPYGRLFDQLKVRALSAHDPSSLLLSV
jgi:regulator of protease activity HflC (stomatin/prohibitin superfamily)